MLTRRQTTITQFAGQRSYGRGQVVSVAADEHYAICWASANDHLDVVATCRSTFLAPDPSARDNDAIRRSYIHGQGSTCRSTFLAPDPSTRDNDAIRTASRNGQTFAVKMLTLV